MLYHLMNTIILILRPILMSSTVCGDCTVYPKSFWISGQVSLNFFCKRYFVNHNYLKIIIIVSRLWVFFSMPYILLRYGYGNKVCCVMLFSKVDSSQSARFLNTLHNNSPQQIKIKAFSDFSWFGTQKWHPEIQIPHDLETRYIYTLWKSLMISLWPVITY
jgi:hypothetical protein